jgi:hypothetical protein
MEGVGGFDLHALVDAINGLRDGLTESLRGMLTALLQQQWDAIWPTVRDWLLGAIPMLLVKGVFLGLGFVGRFVLLALGGDAALGGAWLVGTPADGTYQLPAAVAVANLCTGVGALLLLPALTWSVAGYTAGLGREGLTGLAKRALLGVVGVFAVHPLLRLAIDFTHALALAITDAGPGIPGWGGAVETLAFLGNPEAIQLATGDTLTAGAVVFVYAVAAVLGGVAALVRVWFVGAMYALAPLAVAVGVSPLGWGLLAGWARAFFGALLVVIPAACVLRFAAESLTVFAQGDPNFWNLVGGIASVFGFSTLLGGAVKGGAASLIGVAARTAGAARRFR